MEPLMGLHITCCALEPLVAAALYAGSRLLVPGGLRDVLVRQHLLPQETAAVFFWQWPHHTDDHAACDACI